MFTVMDINIKKKVPIKHALLNHVGKRIARSYRKRYNKDPDTKKERMPFGEIDINVYPDEFRIPAEIIFNRFVKSNYRKFHGKRKRVKKQAPGSR